MQNNKYLDPENVIEIKEEIKNTPTLGDLKIILDKTFPDWVQGFINDYSDDYPNLKQHWMNICFENKVTPKQIMIVDFVSFEDNYSLIRIFSEILTLSGFCVRSKNELFSCKNCGKAIPQSHVYNLLKEGGQDIPDLWRTTCSNC